MRTIDTDYLIVGSGTAGLAFADTLIAESGEAHITIVDRHGKPGGHWNDAYGFVTLHQPSAFYGVNSMELGSGRIDAIGLNKGLFELASGAEICGYFDRVMQHRLLPSGRVAYHPMCNDVGDGTFESLLSGERTRVNVRKKRVDAHYAGPRVPSTHQRRFSVAPGVQVVAPNALPQLWQHMRTGAGDGVQPMPRRFVVLGAGKTAMDTVVWLLQSGASTDAITWVMPRDSWLINRVNLQPGEAFFHAVFGNQADQMQAFAQADSLDDLFLRLESCGALLRIFADQTPTMFHLATIAPGEVELLRTVRHVVRQGRVKAVEPGRMVLDRGVVSVEPGSLFIDCTASAVEPRATQPIFQDGQIVLQMVRLPQPAFSAALTAYVEVHHGDDATRNRLCATVPFPHRMADYPLAMLVHMGNQFHWGQDKALRAWMRESRLDGFGKLMALVGPTDTDRQAILMRLREQSMAAVANLKRLVAAAG
jgi:hypothetical protein